MASTLSNTEAASRQKCLDDLDDYINQCQSDISSMLDELGWTPDHFVQPKKRNTCPHNNGHIMPNSSLPEHTRRCELVSQGCTKEEAEKILVDTSYVYQGCSCVYKESIDIEKLNAVLWNYHMKNNSVFYGYKVMPLTPNEEEQMLSREDRLGLADFIVNRAKEAKKLKELGRDELLVSENLADLVKREDEVRQLDHVEELAALRDYRRRRQTYRAKNVHITKKSHTEIVREVITNQMDMYAKSLTDQAVIEEITDRVKESHVLKYSKEHSNQRESVSRATQSQDAGEEEDRRRSERSERQHFRKSSPNRDRRERSSSQHRRETRDRSASRERREGSRSRHRRETRDRSASRDRRERSKSPSRRKRSRSRDRETRRDRSRSRSDSTSRHKKHKHKKHKKHKHQASDTEERAPTGKANN